MWINTVKDIEKNEIEINTKDCDNLFWILFKDKNCTLNFDKINIKKRNGKKYR